ncbi:hypothetical protein L596_018171 [Steinernema carpocapsae]|uniref:G-protein coupled receptors family 1 profile domain-containing protein n=1 Tax=Steinernema carpocapsae TaxID=34508 RepID=A0A4U5N3W5_STECR|nr:hypothetical protein L596_018171 [Steinernema carpocapsae]
MGMLEAEVILYIVLGTIGLLVNIPVIIAIFWSAQLRLQKEFIIIAGLCITDAINALGFVVTGAYRQAVINEGKDHLVSRYFCLTSGTQGMNVATDQAFAWILLVITLDRIYAVYNPIKYFKRTYQYAWTVLGGKNSHFRRFGCICLFGFCS